MIEVELRTAGARLRADGDRDEAIHDARRSLKKARSALKLIGSRYRAENARLRAIGRSLSPLRDAAALIETLDSLRVKYRKKVSAEGFRAARATLARMKQVIDGQPGTAKVLLNAAKQLSKKRGPWHPERSGSAELERTLRKGKRALKRVHKHPLPENFHTLRKRVKTYRFQLRLLGEPVTEDLDDLDGWLGEAHNLTVLEQRIAEEPPAFGVKHDVDEILRLIAKRQKKLQKKSLATAKEIYS